MGHWPPSYFPHLIWAPARTWNSYFYVFLPEPAHPIPCFTTAWMLSCCVQYRILFEHSKVIPLFSTRVNTLVSPHELIQSVCKPDSILALVFAEQASHYLQESLLAILTISSLFPQINTTVFAKHQIQYGLFSQRGIISALLMGNVNYRPGCLPQSHMVNLPVFHCTILSKSGWTLTFLSKSWHSQKYALHLRYVIWCTLMVLIGQHHHPGTPPLMFYF